MAGVGSTGTGMGMGVGQANGNPAFRPATPNSRYVFIKQAALQRHHSTERMGLEASTKRTSWRSITRS